MRLFSVTSRLIVIVSARVVAVGIIVTSVVVIAAVLHYCIKYHCLFSCGICLQYGYILLHTCI